MKNKELFISRQIASLGLEMQTKINELNIFIFGLESVGIEILKNLLLTCVKSIGLYDISSADQSDKGFNFFFKGDSKMTRASSAKTSYQHLNSFTPIHEYMSFSNFPEFLPLYDVVVITKCFEKSLLLKINKFCREKQIGFIYCGLLSYFGFLFLDYGKNFAVLDTNGKPRETLFIKEIKKGEEDSYIIEFFEYDEEIFLNQFQELSLHNIPEFPFLEKQKVIIKKILERCRIEVSIANNQEKSNDNILYSKKLAITEKEKTVLEFQDLEEAFANPKFMKLDFANANREAHLFLVLRSFLEFVEKYGELPKLKDKSILRDVAEIINFENICNGFENEEIRIDFDSEFEKEMLDLTLEKNKDFPPLGSLIGALTSLEILKFTKKFVPLTSWFIFDIYDVLKKIPFSISNCENLYEFFLGEKIMESIKQKK